MKTNLSWNDLGAGSNGISLHDEWETTLSSGQNVIMTAQGMTNQQKGQQFQALSTTPINTTPKLHRQDVNFLMFLLAIVVIAIIALVVIVALVRGGNRHVRLLE